MTKSLIFAAAVYAAATFAPAWAADTDTEKIDKAQRQANDAVKPTETNRETGEKVDPVEEETRDAVRTTKRAARKAKSVANEQIEKIQKAKDAAKDEWEKDDAAPAPKS